MNSQTYHQREMEERIRRFDSECEMAVNHIGHLKDQARSFLDQLYGEPREIKTRFLHCMKQLDEFMYHMTEFNLMASNLEKNASMGPNAYKNSAPTQKSKRHTKTSPHFNTCRSPKTKASGTREQARKEFRDSGSAEKKKISEHFGPETTDVDVCPHDILLHRKADGRQPLGLPLQPNLEPVCEATIINVSGGQLWLLVDDDLFTNLVSEMTEYYKNQEMIQDFVPDMFCAYFDEQETKCFLRALYLYSEDDPEVFLVDTGEYLPALQSRLRPLHPRFCSVPALAHLCLLADVDQTEDSNLEDRHDEFLKQFLGQKMKMKRQTDDVEDNSAKPVAVYLFHEDGTSVNELLVQALAQSKPELKEKSPINNIPTTPDENQYMPISQPESKHKLLRC